ncbi:uncharacterized protein LOC100846253 isoform X2 [Brachypodium distachyon]|nr:uncharacterized protein LOC100846253 isoform X2 [Brachypodium distachyon]|eukprot:XP_010238034.1 uncharacterized protein LOC100846253 isoform X2 [Brachypodium distachyon]
MASSVAAMPHESAQWRDPSRPRGGRFFNVLIPPQRPSFSDAGGGSSSCAPSEPTPRRRRIILERWAAAAAAATAAAPPEPADARRRELSELTSATRPVAARAAVFREPSPAPSETSSAAGGPELPPSGPRASSLIQRWREIEAVGPVTPRASGDATSESDGSPRGRVGCIVKKLSGAASLPEEDLEAANSEFALSQSAPASPVPMVRNAAELSAARNMGPKPPKLVIRTVRGRRAMEELVARMAHRRRRELAALAERHTVSRFGHKGRIQSMLRLRLLRQGDTVNDEVWNLLRPVRPYPPKCGPEAPAMRDDTRKTDLQEANECSVQNNRVDEQHNDDRNPVVGKSTGLSIENLINSDGSENQQYDEKINANGNQCQEECASSVNSCVHNQEYPKTSNFVRYDDRSSVYDNQYVDDISPSTTSTLRELQDTPSSRGEIQDTPSSRGDTLREEDNQSLNGSWDERALWMSGLGWPAPVDTMSPDSWHQDTIGDIENHNQIEFVDRPWIESPNSWRSLHIATQADCRDLSGNADICNLLESKKVSKSLESDFSSKMNHLLLAILQKQRQQHMIDDFGGYYQEHLYWQRNDGRQNEDQVASAPCSLAPVSQCAAHPEENWQHSSFEHQHHENQNLLEMEVRVRSEIAQIHHEIYELRKLAESCIASQVKIQHSIKEEVCSALREAGLMPSQPDITANRGSCCICREMQVDSLLYRCGHMCTCFNCADQLKSSSRSCPICQSPIDDVVRAHPNF